MKLTLKEFLKLNRGNAVEVVVKEPDKAAKYWTTLRDGKSNIHTDNDLHRVVYSIKAFNSAISVYCW